LEFLERAVTVDPKNIKVSSGVCFADLIYLWSCGHLH
jgi:hypothetical protein